ncbi:hypothetical protein KIF53_13160 [Chromobacterium subtsugae]|uniref:Pyruvate decarboxylase n=1 Tax=Chromobacterium subtsugae TaxID=251747 RepID=A0ABS7FH10_9NEIS|nr:MULTISPECIES: thiamine pyrophosphate-dependent enzyme [Chromobacterium]MBW7565716.1 alpha-keto acid decarboxylase family protein [Chromobacterium subtsugae]MBW8288579.1 hypothetical protein [Chromobacterium subtsugae]WSE89813.1 thiamine pyrophosphate-dependent enzyme [Chromobacterium subtsugae]WVH58184.1 thiamine pyrophosphate-dependent enzyme [Chromobacterium subtsugae]
MTASTPAYTVSNYILDRLRQLGVQHLFEVPGDYASIFLNTLDECPAIERIPNINESGVGYASDGYGRFKGAAACSVQYGVGTFSILNCFAGGFVERVPMALIGPSPSTQNRELARTEGILFHHSTGNLNADMRVMENVTAAAVAIHDGASAPALIDEALTAMLTHRRPVYIEVWQDIFGVECARPRGELRAVETASEPAALQAMLDLAWQTISDAALPVFWLGVEIQRYGLQELAQQLVDASGLFFTTTSLGKTVLDESQASFIGTYAGPASPALTREVMGSADCVVALGAIITDDYLGIMAQDYARMVEINDEAARIGCGHYQGVYLRDFMQGLLARFQRRASARRYRLPQVSPDPQPSLLPTDGLTYDRFYHVLGDWLIREGHIRQAKLILGESTSLYVFGNLFGMPRDAFVAQAAWGSLGHETGCALGVELATGQRPLVVAGDGGFMMICQEISSLVRQRSNAVVFVMSNAGYAIEQAFVNLNAFTPQDNYAAFDLLPNWDYLALAKAFGARGHVVETVDQLRKLLKQLEHMDGVPNIVQVKIPLKDLPPQLRRLASG